MEITAPIIHLDFWELAPKGGSHEELSIFRRLVQVIYYCSITHHELNLRKKYAIRLRGTAYFPDGEKDYGYVSDRIVRIVNPNPFRQVAMRTPIGKNRHLYAATNHGTTFRLYFHRQITPPGELLALAAHNPPHPAELDRYFTSII